MILGNGVVQFSVGLVVDHLWMTNKDERWINLVILDLACMKSALEENLKVEYLSSVIRIKLFMNLICSS